MLRSIGVLLLALFTQRAHAEVYSTTYFGAVSLYDGSGLFGPSGSSSSQFELNLRFDDQAKAAHSIGIGEYASEVYGNSFESSTITINAKQATISDNIRAVVAQSHQTLGHGSDAMDMRFDYIEVTHLIRAIRVS